MKILLVHNYYRSSSPSGENRVFEREKALLEKAGHQVLTYTRHSDEIARGGYRAALRVAFFAPFNPSTRREVRSLLEHERPDVMHIHNTFPVITPSAVWAAAGLPVAVVHRVPNYRLLCPAGTLLLEGEVCTRCIHRRIPWPGVLHGCYRSSRLATIPLAINVALHKSVSTWRSGVHAFVALSQFQRRLLVEAGLPGDRVHVKPNFLDADARTVPFAERDKKVVYVGRLSREKGVDVLVEAWRRYGAQAPLLEIIGTGELKTRIEQQIADGKIGSRVRLVGQQTLQQTMERMSRARLLVLPSIWYETFGLAIIEAYAKGVPVACSDLGPLSERVIPGQTGDLFTAGDPESLLSTVESLWCDQQRLEQLGNGALVEFKKRYTGEANLEHLHQIYDKAIHLARSSD